MLVYDIEGSRSGRFVEVNNRDISVDFVAARENANIVVNLNKSQIALFKGARSTTNLRKSAR